MDGKPVTIRTIDPPLHEFLPHDDEGQKEVAKELGVLQKLLKKESKHFTNLIRCWVSADAAWTYFPEITEMQARAIFEATVNVKKEGKTVLPEVMIPLVGNVKELKNQNKSFVKLLKQ